MIRQSPFSTSFFGAEAEYPALVHFWSTFFLPGAPTLLCRILRAGGVILLLALLVTVGGPADSLAASLGPQGEASEDGVSEPYASQTGRFGLSLMFSYDALQTPAPVKLYQDSIGGVGEISYGLFRGIRILGGAGFNMGSPHLAPPLNVKKSSGPSISYVPVYAGLQVELTRWFPSMIRYQPWFPYLRGDTGGVFTSVSNDGPASLHTNGLMEDLGFGIEARPRAVPMAFFGEIRSQWLFLGSQIITVIPVMAGTTFYF
ncbi:MAG: hypothetical protein ACYDBP_02555 [Leptospirales bacterium]